MMFLAIHGPFIVSSNAPKLEGPGIFVGDFTYYLDGAISVLQTDPYEKFNNKHQPIMASRPVAPGTLPPHTALVAALYPFPSFKFGYSLTAAALTWPFDQALFERSIPRLSATNLALGAGVLVLIFLTLHALSGNLAVPAAACVFYIFDVFNIHNNYLYQSHTLAGIFYVLLSYFMFVRSNVISPLLFSLISNLLVFSILTSSHVVLLSAGLGGLMFLWVCLRERTWGQRLTYAAAGFLGAAAWPAYIRLVEIYVGFRDLGLPFFHGQFSNYSNTVSELISTYPLLERQLWDLRIWNPFIWAIVLLIAATYFIAWLRDRRSPPRGEGPSKSWLARSWADKSLLFIVAAVFSIAGTAFYSQPIVRAIVPHLFLVDMLLGVLLGVAVLRTSRLGAAAAAIAGALLVFNYSLYHTATKDGGTIRYITAPPYAPGPYVWRVSERELTWKYVEQYFHQGAYRTIVLPHGKLGQHSMSIPEFVEFLKKRLANEVGGKHLDELWVRLEPMEIIEQYSHTRRFIPKFTAIKENVVNAEALAQDFRLWNEILNLQHENRLPPGAFVSRSVFYWNPVIFDQEYNYIYGYNGGIAELARGLPLAQVDFRSIYYVRFSALEKVALGLRAN